MGEFGNKFRTERERQGISLEDVSSATKIGSRMLRAIEEEDFDRLPGGVFNKGFIRAYAKHLGLNDDEAVAGYLDCLRQSQLDSQEVWDPQVQPGAPVRRPPGEPRRRAPQGEELPELQLPRAEHVSPPRRYGLRRERAVPWRILALALLVVVLALLLWRRHSPGPRTQAAATSPATSATQPANTSGQTTTGAALTLPTASTPNTAPRSPRATPSGLGGAAHPLKPVPVKPVANAEVESSNEVTGEPAVQSNQTGNPLATLSATPTAPLNLEIRASENSWISVTADGRSVLHELLIAPAHASIHANREIVLKVGNAGGVTFLWNGEELPAPGAEAEVKTLVFDETGMRDATPDQAPPQNQ